MPNAAPAAATHPPGEADRTLTLEHVFKAPPADVFRAWTDPGLLMQWWGPEGSSAATVTELDLRPGGGWSIRIGGAHGDQVVSGVYREVTPPRRLVMTWAWDRAGSRGHETVVDVSFEPAGSWTRVKLVQRLFQTPEQAVNHNWGWTSSFVDLDKLFAAQ